MTRHRTHDRRHLVLWWAVAALVLVLFAHTPAARAQSTECEAVDQYDMPRECTFLEEHGMTHSTPTTCAWRTPTTSTIG